MPRTVVPFHAEDISALARNLKRMLDQRSRDAAAQPTPGHVEWLNLLARAAGYRNYQHLRADGPKRQAAFVGAPAPEEVVPASAVSRIDTPSPLDLRRIEAAVRCFDGDGVMLRWPARTSQQHLCLWKLWSGFPAARDLAEREVNAHLQARNLFGDHVLLRRELVNRRLLARTPDGRIYRRVEQAPPPEALAVIRAHMRQG